MHEPPLRRPSSTTSRPSAACSPRPTSSTWSRAASPRTRSSARSPTRSSCRTSACSRAATRSSTRCCCSAARTRTCRSCRSAGASASRRRGTSAATTTRRTCPIEELIFVPENAQYYAAFGAVLYGLHEAAHVGVFTPVDAASTSTSRHGRKARLGETRGPAARRRRATELDEFTRALRDPEVRCRRRFEPGETVRAVIGLDGGSTSSQGRPRRRRDGKILCKAYQLSKGNPIQDTKELLAQLRGYVDDDQGAKLEVMGFGAHRLRGRRARGVRARRREHRRDRRAHDERGALLRRRRRHLRHRRAGHQGPVHEERRHRELPPLELAARPATACCSRRWPTQFGVPVTEYADVAFKARARAEVQLRLRRLPRHRSRELPEGGLLEGGDARGPRAGAAEERLAVRRADPAPRRARHASSSSRAARSTTSRPSRRRSTTSRSASRAREVFVHPHTGEAGAIGAAIETLRVVKRRRARSTLHRHRCGDRPRVHDEERRRDGLSLLPEQVQAHVHRHEAAPTARPAATSRASRARRAPSRARRRCSRSSTSARRSRKQFPNIVDYEAKRAFMHFYDARADARGRLAGQGRRGQEGLLRHPPRRGRRARSSARRRRRWRSAAPRAHRHPARAQPLLDRRRSSGRTSRRSASRSRTSSSATRRPKRCGSRAASTARSTRATRARSRRRTSTTCSSTSTPTKKPLKYIFFPILTHVPNFVDGHDGQRELPDRRRRAGRDEGGVHEGGRLLRDARHRVPRSGALVRRADAHGAAHVRDLGPAPRHHRGRERLTPAQRGLQGARRSSSATCRRRAARSSRRSRPRTASPS